MFRNQFVISLRNLVRNPVYSAINIGGLALGIAVSILILLWVWNEMTYDRQHKNLSQLYKVLMKVHTGNEVKVWNGVPPFVHDQLEVQRGMFRKLVVVSDPLNEFLSVGDKVVKKRCLYVGPEYLDMFQFDLIAGSREKALTDPNSVVLTASTARALFGEADPINHIISLNNQRDLRVTCVIKDLPANSSFPFSALLTFKTFQDTAPWVKDCVNDADCDWLHLFAELEAGVDLENVNRAIGWVMKAKTNWLSKELFLYPLSRWNLHGEFENGVESGDDQGNFVSAFVLAAFGILMVACINFMNLSTARSERRAREIGIRKISGSLRRDLIFQFLRESVVVSFMAFLFALVMVELALPFYNDMLEKSLSIDYSSWKFWLAGFSLVLTTGLIAGSYPAFFLSAFQPVKVLKGTPMVDGRSVLPRKALVIIQFGFSIFLIVGTVAVYQQINYSKGRQLGYDKHNLITVPNNKGLSAIYTNLLKNDLLQSGVVLSSCKTNSPITEVYESNFMSWSDNPGPIIPVDNIFCEYDYAKTMGIKLIAGRDFSEQFTTDTSAVLLNQTAANLSGLKRPLGAIVKFGSTERRVIGILEDVLMDSPYHPVMPTYFALETAWKVQSSTQNISIRLAETNDVPGAIRKIENIFKKRNPQYPFEYSFVDEDFGVKFKKINVIWNLANIFAGVAILIACLGLFGLAAFTAERRTKEFGVRKVLGAGRLNLVALISRDFIRMVFIAFLIAAPVSWWLVTRFLESYPIHIAFDWSILPLAGIAVLILSLAVVASQALIVASANPVDSLRSE